MSRYFYIGSGGFLGAVARYWVGGWVMERWAHRWPAGSAFPYGTFVINVTGCFILGFFLTLADERVSISPNWRFFFPTGFVGAYTTFSTYEFESFSLIQRGSVMLAAINLTGSVASGFLAVWAGAVVARLL